jgi:hypothetical protein
VTTIEDHDILLAGVAGTPLSAEGTIQGRREQDRKRAAPLKIEE